MPGNLEHLPQVHELNRVFLGLLQIRVMAARHCFWLPPPAVGVLRLASPEMLDAVARFPRALFRLEVTPTTRGARDAGPHHDAAEHDLTLSMLHAVRHTSRQSAYQARVLFDLSVTEVARLCALSLPDLQRLACLAGVLQCAFRDRTWLWLGLLTTTRPELRRQLQLMALQPGLTRDWPQRRPPLAST